MITGTNPPDWLAGQGQVISLPLDESTQKSLRDDLYALAKRSNGEVGDGFFDAWGKFMQDRGKVRSDRTVVAEMFTPMVRTGKVGGLRWLLDFLESDPTLLADYKPAYIIKDLKTRVKESQEAAETEDTTELAEMLKAIGDLL